MPPRVVLAGLFHETHSFLGVQLTRADFHELLGDELRKAEGDGSPLAAMVEVGKEKGWEVIPAIDLRANPGPMVADEVFDRFCSVFSDVVNRELQNGIDGVCLVLHGAMATASHPDVEGEVVVRLLKLIGPDIPVGGVLDLHGNISREFADNTQGFVVYRQNPHADAHAAARDGGLLLDRLMRTGEKAVTVWERPPVMWPPTGTGTALEPMKTLEAMAREIERNHPEILAVNVFGGFSFTDTPESGVSFTAVTVGDPTVAKQELRKLADYTWEHRKEGNVREMPLATAMAKLREHSRGPVMLAEPSDNIGGGAPGDGTAMLRAFVENGIQGAAIAINDPESVAKAAHCQPGDKITLDIGGKAGPLSGGPVRLEVVFVSRSDGRFELEDIHSHLASMSGSHWNMGPSAVVRHRGVTILLTTNKTPPFDLAQWRSQGINPEELFAINVKSAVAYRCAYDPIALAHYSVETPGPCTGNLSLFPFRHLKRPVYPLDKEACWPV